MGAFVSFGQPAQAKELRRLEPASKWVLEYADENCRLARNFGEGDDQITLVLDQFIPGDNFRVTLAGKKFGPSHLRLPLRASIRFGPNESPSTVDGLAALIGRVPAIMISGPQRIAGYSAEDIRQYKEAENAGRRLELQPVGSDRERAATWLELRSFGEADAILKTGSMHRSMEALRKCSWDTVKLWGLDIDEQKNLVRRAIPKKNPSSWIGPEDYPEKMIKSGGQSILTFRLIVDETGKPVDCRIQRSTRPKDFDNRVCSVFMRRASFEPALNAAGKPVRSFFGQSVTFRIAG